MHSSKLNHVRISRRNTPTHGLVSTKQARAQGGHAVPIFLTFDLAQVLRCNRIPSKQFGTESTRRSVLEHLLSGKPQQCEARLQEFACPWRRFGHERGVQSLMCCSPCKNAAAHLNIEQAGQIQRDGDHIFTSVQENRRSRRPCAGLRVKHVETGV